MELIIIWNKKSLILINPINILHDYTLNIHLIRFPTDGMLNSTIELLLGSNTKPKLLKDSFLALFTQSNLVKLFERLDVLAFEDNRCELIKCGCPNRTCAVCNLYG